MAASASASPDTGADVDADADANANADNAYSAPRPSTATGYGSSLGFHHWSWRLWFLVYYLQLGGALLYMLIAPVPLRQIAPELGSRSALTATEISTDFFHAANNASNNSARHEGLLLRREPFGQRASESDPN